MRELFVYWRTADADAAEHAGQVWQAELRDACEGLIARLYRRAGETPADGVEGLVTLMETYAGPALDASLERRIVDEGNQRLREWLAGPRHVEVFVRRSR